MKSSCLLIIFAAFSISNADERPVVHLPEGTIAGRVDTTFTGKNYYTFAKVPYAAAPVGNLRFQAPQKHPYWTGVLNTTEMNVVCYQTNYNSPQENEDCLYLNVYTPQLPSGNNSKALLPVIFFIYGGGFVNGDTTQFNPRNLIDQNVIGVSINYRLGVFGFASTGDEVITGNFGLKDQQFALTWTHDNIHLFGGDPKQITLLGLSAGSASVSYQLLSEKNRGLIKGAIMLSGSALSPWAYQRNAREINFKTAAILNPLFKTSRNSLALRNFLRLLNGTTLDNAAEKYRDDDPYYMELMTGFNYAPVVEANVSGAFLTEKMYGALKSGRILNVPTLVGLTSEEMLFAFQDDDNNLKKLLTAYDSNPGHLVPPDMLIKSTRNVTLMAQNITKLYKNSTGKLADNLGRSLGYFSDNGFTRSIIKYAEFAAKVAKVFFYEFSYQGAINAKKHYYPGAGKASHGDDLWFLDSDWTKASPEDRVTIQRLVKIYTDFAKFQNPTPEKSSLLNNITWPAVDTKSGDFYYVNINNTVEIRNHPKNDTYKGWVKLYDSLGYDNFDTY